MQFTVEYKNSKSLLKDLKYEVGNGKHRSLSFYMLPGNLKVSVLEDYLFLSIIKNADLESSDFKVNKKTLNTTCEYMADNYIQATVINRSASKFNKIIKINTQLCNRNIYYDRCIFNITRVKDNGVVNNCNFEKTLSRTNQGLDMYKDQKMAARNRMGYGMQYWKDIKVSSDNKEIENMPTLTLKDGDGEGVEILDQVKTETYTNGLFEHFLESSLYRHEPNIVINDDLPVDDQGGNEIIISKEKRLSTHTGKLGDINNGFEVGGQDNEGYYAKELLVGGQDNLLNNDKSFLMIGGQDNLLNVFESDAMGYIYDDGLQINEYFAEIKQNNPSAGVNEYYEFLNGGNKNIFMYKRKYMLNNSQNYIKMYEILSCAKGKKGVLFDTKVQQVRKSVQKAYFVESRKFLFHPDPELYINKDNIFIGTGKINGNQAPVNINELLFANTPDKIMYSQETELLLYKDYHGSFTDDKTIFLDIINKDRLFIVDNKYVDLDDKSIDIFSTGIDLSSYDKSFILGFDTSLDLSKYSPGINKEYNEILISKYYHSIDKKDRLKGFIVRKRDLHVNEEFKRIEKISRDLYIQKKDKFVSKADGKDTSINYAWELVTKDTLKFELNNNDIFISKNTVNTMLTCEQLFMSKFTADVHGLVFDPIFLSKNIKHTMLDTNDIITASKGLKHASIYDCYNWISKARKDGYANFDPIFIDKNKHTGFIEDHTWISKNNKNTSIDDDILLINKNPKLAMTYDTYFWIDKDSKKFFFDDSITQFSKYNKETNINSSGLRIDKYNNRTNVESGVLNVGKHNKDVMPDTMTEEYIFINTSSKNGMVEDGLSVFTGDKMSRMYTNESASINNKATNYYIDDNLLLDKYISNASIYQNKTVKNNVKETCVHEVEWADKPMKGIYMEYDSIFVTSIAFDGNDAPEEDISADGPIDELILPQSDFKYKKYISKLINEDGTINLQYVKSFDAESGEYTIKVPIEHPFEIYADIAREYIDVKVEILEQIIYIVTQIWKEDMFKYASMSAQDSLKKLLKQLMEQIKKKYSSRPDLLKEALRCLQLFRWYSEMAVLNNCDYILKFKTKEVKVDYFNNDLKEFSEFATFENMSITENGILEQTNNVDNCKMVFVNNQKNPGAPLNISFKLYNVNCNSSISIIDGSSVKRTNYKGGIHEISIEVKDRAEVEFIRNGEYQNMAAAMLKVSNYQTDGYTIRYKGKFGETNQVMQDLLDRMLVVGEASQELKDKLSDVAPVTVAIDTLLKYFELHHQDKSKGRRLITKK